MHELSHRALRAFLAVVDCGSFSTAASTANISQPALSRIVAEMEDRFGVKLFERNSKGTFPTDAGAALIPYARALLFEMGQAAEAVEAVRGLRKGTVRIGSAGAIIRHLLPSALERLLKTAPGLKVELIEGSDDRLIAALLQREIDVVIGTRPPQNEEVTIIGECEFTDSFVAFCRAGHPLTERGDLSLADLDKARWAVPGLGTSPRELFESRFRLAGSRPPDVAFETMSADVVIAVIGQTDLLGWLPHSLIRLHERIGSIRSLGIPELNCPRQFFIYRRATGLLPEPAKLLLAEIPLRT